MFSLASKLLFTVASPAFQKAYDKGCSIWDAKDELDKLRRSIQTIQVVLVDAEKKQESSSVVKDWVNRVRDVLYDVDDLFDEVATNDMLKQQIIKEGKLLKKVRASCSKLNPIVSRNSIANKVKDIRKRLLEISTDMKLYKFVKFVYEQPISGVRKGQDLGSLVDSRDVFGREKDKQSVLEILLHEDQLSNDFDFPLVIVVVGIGGMGKTTLAQLVYNDEEVQQRFENKWFACISDISDDEEVLGKIFQSISGKKYNNFTVDEIQTRIREMIKGKKFLLVLDDVWDDDRGRWIKRMRLLSGGAKGSKIIVTARSSSVARALEAFKTIALDGLSEDESWALFKSLALTPEQEKDSRWSDLGKEIVKKCANVPLAIKSIGSLLHGKTTIQEWESVRNEEFTMLGERGKVSVMSVLKLSYDHLHSSLKQCFAYCSLFPKDYMFKKHDLIHLWIAQGYIKPNNSEQTVEEVGHSYFMDLFRMSFFQEATYDHSGEIEECKMHDLIHDLAKQVAGEENITLNTLTIKIKGTPRHASVGCVTGGSSANLVPLLNGNRLRSLFLIDAASSTRGLDLDQEFTKLMFLRTLKLSESGIENVPSCIGELKHLRYLDMSMNKFKRLPDSITKLLNLCTLNVYLCRNLEVLPNDLRKLANLRHLIIEGCDSLKHMPPGFGELASLQHLDVFKVGRGMGRGQCGKLGELFGLNLRGELVIEFGDKADDDDWDGVEDWKPLVNLKGLGIFENQGMRISYWDNRRAKGNPTQLLLPNLTTLSLGSCHKVKSLQPLRHLPNLKFLFLAWMHELEYIEEEEEGEKNENTLIVAAASDASFLAYLETLELYELPKLKGWSRKVSMPQFPTLGVMTLKQVDAKLIPQLFSDSCPSTITSSLSSLKCVKITKVYELMSFPGRSLTSLRYLSIKSCHKLNGVELPPSHLNILEELSIKDCQELEMWEESDKRGVDWDSIPNLRRLIVTDIPSPERLPSCLQNLQSLGKLQIKGQKLVVY